MVVPHVTLRALANMDAHRIPPNVFAKMVSWESWVVTCMAAISAPTGGHIRLILSSFIRISESWVIADMGVVTQLF